MFKKRKKLKEAMVGLGGKNEYIKDNDGLYQTPYSSILDRYNIDLSKATFEEYSDMYDAFAKKADRVALAYGGTTERPPGSPYMLPAFKGDVQRDIQSAIRNNKKSSVFTSYIEQTKSRAQGAEIIMSYLEAIQNRKSFSTDTLFRALLEATVILPAAPIRENLARIRDVVLGFVTIDADRDELITAGKLLEQSLLPLLNILYTANVETLRAQDPVLDAVIEKDELKLSQLAAKKARKKSAL